MFLISLLLIKFTRGQTCPQDSYDFIVVGSGPGGGPLAANLANAGYKTLLLEAGDKYTSDNVTIPAFAQLAAEDENITWNYRVKHYPESTGKRQSVLYPRGSAVGGSASNNALIVKIPHKTDFDNLANLVGDQSWNDDNMRQYFTRIEQNHVPGWNGKGHGYNGWLHTSHLDIKTGFIPNVDPAVIKLTTAPLLKINPTPGGTLLDGGDVNGGNNNMNEGWQYIPQNVFQGRRAGLVSHLHSQIDKNQNLVVKTNHLVTKILFDESNTAIGVEAQFGKSLYKADPRNSGSEGTKVQYYAKREVIVSAGAYNSPQILMMSGIGDEQHLTEKGIPVRVNLPGVGRNLMDRYEIGVVSKTRNGFNSFRNCLFQSSSSDTCYNYYKQTNGAGAYSSNGLVVGVDKKFRGSAVPNAFIFAAPGYFQGYYPGFSQEPFKKPGHQTWAILIAHTQNKGRVKLKSNNPFETPDINFNYFPGGMNDPDLLVALDALKYARWLNSRNGLFDFVSWGSQVAYEALPGANLSDEQLKQWIIDNAWGHHACCTNKIGKSDDQFAVLDKDFKVRGVKNLRVVDASVFPEIPGFFLQAPVMMISEKAADAIIAQAKQSKARC